MATTKIRFEGISSDSVHEKPFKVGTVIEIAEVQDSRCQVMVSHGSIGGTFRPIVFQVFELNEARAVFLNAVNDAFAREEKPVWIDMPYVKDVESRRKGEAAIEAIENLQKNWKT